MTKIKINYFKLYIFIALISLLDLLLTDSFKPDPKNSFMLVQVGLIIILISSYFIQQKSSMGLFVSKNGFVWRTNGKEFIYPWDTVKVRVLIDFMSFTVIEISTDKSPKYRLLLSWLMEKDGLEKIESLCPKNQNLYKYFKKYSK